MLETVLTRTDGSITFLFLFGTICFMYPERDVQDGWRGPHRSHSLPRGITVLLWMLCFTAVHGLLDAGRGYMSLYLFLMVLFALAGTVLFLKTRIRERTICTFMYLALIVSIKAFLTMLQFLRSSADRTVWDSVLFYVFFYAGLLLCSLFFVRHPIRFNAQIPAGYTVLISLCGVCGALIPTFSNWANRGQDSFQFETVFIDAVSVAMILLIYYLVYALLELYERLLETSRLSLRQQAEISALHHTKTTINQIRQERHELKNNYFYINSLVKEKKYDELEKYLDETLSYRLTSMEEFKTGNHLLDILLTQKVAEARDSGIRVVCHLLMPGPMAIDNDEFCSLLLNLWNNAIEACRKVQDPAIDFSLTGSHGYADIVLRNSAGSDVFQNNARLATTKKDKENHGIGLRLIRRIVRKNNGILSLHMDGSDFVAEVMLPLA